MKKSGFTLAEVLITLTIIGVIASMTLPGLMTSTQNQDRNAKLKKSIGTFNQAIQMGNSQGFVITDNTSLMTIMKKFMQGTEVTANSVFVGNDGIKYTLAASACTYKNTMGTYTDSATGKETAGTKCGSVTIQTTDNAGAVTLTTTPTNQTDKAVLSTGGSFTIDLYREGLKPDTKQAAYYIMTDRI